MVHHMERMMTPPKHVTNEVLSTRYKCAAIRVAMALNNVTGELPELPRGSE